MEREEEGVTKRRKREREKETRARDERDEETLSTRDALSLSLRPRHSTIDRFLLSRLPFTFPTGRGRRRRPGSPRRIQRHRARLRADRVGEDAHDDRCALGEAKGKKAEKSCYHRKSGLVVTGRRKKQNRGEFRSKSHFTPLGIPIQASARGRRGTPASAGWSSERWNR